MGKKTEITKEDAIALFTSKAELARALKLTRSAVSQWPDGEPIPEAQALKLRYEIVPEKFVIPA